jgi:hypothetical protein|tara:strand:- start:11757 stop:11936 length:180 start_codon:yes stop_codon:yes gene_type:complete
MTFFVDLANVFGFMLEDLTAFVFQIAGGYFLLIAMLTIGIVLMLYFRFFSQAAKMSTKT